MGARINRVGKFYSSIIIKNIVLFIAYGILSVVFSENGWIPREEIAWIADMIYQLVIPLLIGYIAGRKIGGEIGGIVSVLACTGILAAGDTSPIIGVMFISPITGFITKKLYLWLEKRIIAGFEMLTRNLFFGLVGGVFAVISYYIIGNGLAVVNRFLFYMIDYMINRQMLPLVSLLIEPAKVFFLNNGLNHGILVPLGMEQLKAAGKSVLFLLETNPGPGAGVLLAYYLVKKNERKAFSSCLAVHLLGGIHELYFPFVLMNLKLLAAVMAGGFTGIMVFLVTGAGTVGPVSPGSIITILLMGGSNSVLGLLGGIILSAAVSCLIAAAVLKFDEKELVIDEKEADMDIEKSQVQREIKKIYLVCDAGVGSSAMGAALLRRKLKEAGFLAITAAHTSADEIPEDADLLVTQKDFYRKISSQIQDIDILTISNLMDIQEYETIVKYLRQ